MEDNTRSPIKDKSLRHPGQSLEEERRLLIEDKIEPWMMMALMLAAFAAFEWWRWYTKAPPQPLLMTLASAGMAALAFWRFRRLRPRLKALRLGIEGERTVGQFLERLRESGYQVFHDVQAPGFNIDHVLVGRGGVFTVETKTWSKPKQGEARIAFKDGQLIAGAWAPERDPLSQARGQAAWLKNLLAESAGRAVTVMPVVVFPGWFIEPSAGRRQDIWVLEPKALPHFLEHEPTRLTPPDVKLFSFHLSRFIRSEQRLKDSR